MKLILRIALLGIFFLATYTANAGVNCDIDGDGTVGLEEAIYAMQVASGTVVVPPVSYENLKPQYIANGIVIAGVTGTYGAPSPTTVTSANGRVWMDRNLGAYRASGGSDDSYAYGDLYQWGRLADNHESRTSPQVMVRSDTDVPDHGFFIMTVGMYEDWRRDSNDKLWQGVSGINNPCPAGFRLPTEAEWETEIASWYSKNIAGAYDSPLTLQAAGYRSYADGSKNSSGTAGYYWSSSVDGTSSARVLKIDSGNAQMVTEPRAQGFSVRCIQD